MDIDDDKQLSPEQITVHFKLFLKTWIQIILRERNLYPATSFELRNSFNLSIPWTRHPSLNQWLDGLLDNITQRFKELSCICLIIYDDLSVRERYVVDLTDFLHLNEDRFDDRKVQDSDKNILFHELRSCLYSLKEKVRTLEKPRDGWKFNVICESIGQMDSAWIIDNDDADITERGGQVKDPEKVISLKPVNSSTMVIYSSIEVYK